MGNQDIPDDSVGESAGAVSSLPIRPHLARDEPDHSAKAPIFVALSDLDDVIAKLDNELAMFYDDIKPVLTPWSSDEKSNFSGEDREKTSEITETITLKSELIARITKNLHETRRRIEL